MHVVSWTYPKHGSNEARIRTYKFIHALANVIPCMRCRVDWVSYLSKHFNNVDTPHLDSRAAFTTFLVDGHNHVNRKLNKRVYTYEEARQLYDPNAAEPASFTQYTVVAIVVGVAIAYCCAFRFWTQFATRPLPAWSGPDRRSAECASSSKIFAVRQPPYA